MTGLIERLKFNGFSGTENMLHRTRRWTIERNEASARIAELEGEVQFLCSLCNPHGGESTTYETVKFCGFSIKEITRILAAALSTQENTTMTNRQRLKENKDFAKKGLDWAREFSTCEASWTLALQDYEDACRLYYINLKTEEEE